jgi:copper transport protein
MNFRRFALVLSLILIFTFEAPVFAHAELVRSIPEQNASLPRAPAQIELFLSESIEPSFSRIQVLDSNGARVDNNDSRVDAADPTHLTVSLRSLPDGVYTVAWQVLSAVDGHVTQGAFPFGVGDVDPKALNATTQASRTVKLSLDEIAARWLLYLSTTALTGGTLFVLVVWGPAYQAIKDLPGLKKDPAGLPPWRRLAYVGLLLLIAANVLGLLSQAGKAAGGELAAPWNEAVGTVLFNTRYGALWIARLALALALAGLLPTANGKRDRWIGFALSLLLLLTISLGSHAAAEPEPLWPVAADWIHLIAASAWVGGLTHFVAGMWWTRDLDPKSRTALAARLIPRFSAVAMISVGALTLTGLYTAVLRVGSWAALNTTPYGRTLIVKLIIALPMVMIGAVNLLGVTPRVKHAAANPAGLKRLSELIVDRFRRLITSEITLGVFLLLSVAVLTALPPAQTSSAPPGLNASADVDDLSMDINILPGRIGLNTFTVTVAADGQPLTDAKEVALRFTPVSGKLPSSSTSLEAKGSGQYSIRGAYLNLQDTWQIQAVVRRENKFDAYANFNFELGGGGGQSSYPWYRLAGGAILLAALAYMFAFSALSNSRRQLISAGFVPATALALVSVAVFSRPPQTAEAGPVNPIPANEDSIKQGKEIYTTLCVPCHGETGKGDGPVGLTLNPRPADLSLHAVPGVHSDGQLFEWITNGFPGSVMPAFGPALTEEQRWHLVNYVRTLAPKQ